MPEDCERSFSSFSPVDAACRFQHVLEMAASIRSCKSDAYGHFSSINHAIVSATWLKSLRHAVLEKQGASVTFLNVKFSDTRNLVAEIPLWGYPNTARMPVREVAPSYQPKRVEL
jgi:hypothetical protein